MTPSPPPPEIRPETADDHAAIAAVVTAAFGGSLQAGLVERIRASPHHLPDLALVAEVGGRVVGHVMISTTPLCHDGGERLVAMLSPLAVDPAHQRRGIGTGLVRAAVAGAAGRGEPLVVLEGDPAYYSRLGFEPSGRHGITLPLPAWAPPEAGQVLLLPSYDPVDGSLRGQVVYPPTFAGLG